MSKLTLSVDDAVIVGAKKYAKKRGLSVSRIVENYLAAVVEPPKVNGDDLPVLQSLRGSLNRADLQDYRRRLETKYR